MEKIPAVKLKPKTKPSAKPKAKTTFSSGKTIFKKIGRYKS